MAATEFPLRRIKPSADQNDELSTVGGFRLGVGVLEAGVPIAIPVGFDLIVYCADSVPTITATDRFGGTFGPSALTGVQQNLQYWNTSTEAAVLYNSEIDPIYWRFDGRTFATVTSSLANPYAFVPHDAAAPAGL
jgi:hypothetical protein